MVTPEKFGVDELRGIIDNEVIELLFVAQTSLKVFLEPVFCPRFQAAVEFRVSRQ